MNCKQANSIIQSHFGNFFNGRFNRASHEGDRIVCGSIDGEPGKSFVINLRGQYAGQWHDFNGGKHGDFVELLRLHRGFSTVKEVLQFIEDCGFGDIKAVPEQKLPEKNIKDIAAESRKKIEAARSVWRRMNKNLGLNFRECYLATRGFRGNEVDRITVPVRGEHNGWAKPHYKLRSGDRPFCTIAHPVFHAGNGEAVGIHRIHLNRDKTKFRGQPARTMLGRIKAGVVPVFTVQNGLSATWLVEGVEDALAVAVHTRFTCDVLACMSCGNMVSVAEQMDLKASGTVFIGTDNDSAGTEAAERACRVIFKRGGVSAIKFPDERYKDYNSWLMAFRAGER